MNVIIFLKFKSFWIVESQIKISYLIGSTSDAPEPEISIQLTHQNLIGEPHATPVL